MDCPVLRVLSQKKPITREAALGLWKEGKVSGLFNIPNQEVFDLCQDFCVESQDDPLRGVLENFVKKNVELTQVLAKLKAAVKGLTQENKAQQQQLQHLVTKHKSVVEENAVLQQHVEQLEKENAELKLQLVDTESNFEVREKVSNLKESVRVLQAQVNQLASEKLEIRKKYKEKKKDLQDEVKEAEREANKYFLEQRNSEIKYKQLLKEHNELKCCSKDTTEVLAQEHNNDMTNKINASVLKSYWSLLSTWSGGL